MNKIIVKYHEDEQTIEKVARELEEEFVEVGYKIIESFNNGFSYWRNENEKWLVYWNDYIFWERSISDIIKGE